jgi:hypothetical protein
VASAAAAAAAAAQHPPAGGGPGPAAEPWAQREQALARSWDLHLAAAAELYRGRMYSLLTDNCHGLVVHFLRSAQYGGGKWDMVRLAALLFLRAKYVGWAAWLRTWLPFLLLATAGGYWGGATFAWAYLGVAGGLVAWFVLYTYCIWKPCPRSAPGLAAQPQAEQQWLA